MRRRLVAFLCVTTLLPIVALAAGNDLPAGFAPNSIWVSSTHITAGDSVNIFTVVYNSSDVSLAGNVNFTVDGKSVGTKDFNIKMGGTEIESVAWTATVGNHALAGQIDNISNPDTKTNAAILNHTTNTITVSVASAPPPPPPSPTEAAIQTVTSVLASSTPVVASVAQNFYGLTESVRQGAIEAIEKQLASAQKPKGEVLGAETFHTAAATSSNEAASSIFSTVWQATLKGLLFVCNLRILFYGLLLFIIFMLYQLLRTWMRER